MISGQLLRSDEFVYCLGRTAEELSRLHAAHKLFWSTHSTQPRVGFPARGLLILPNLVLWGRAQAGYTKRESSATDVVGYLRRTPNGQQRSTFCDSASLVALSVLRGTRS